MLDRRQTSRPRGAGTAMRGKEQYQQICTHCRDASERQLVLSLSTCAYCCLRVHRLRQSGQLTLLLRPTKVIFSNKKENDGNDELRTVVAYRNPFTGDYCVHKHREPRGYENEMARCGPRGESETARCDTESADSGLSDEYEPLNVVPQKIIEPTQPTPPGTAADKNRVNKTWNWTYKEYQI